jgi:hypothetical protein
MEHLAEETLSALLDGELHGEEAAAAQAHLDRCAGCRGSLETLRRTAGLLGRLERVVSPDHLVDELERRVERRMVIRGPDRWWRLTSLPRPRPLLLSTAASVVLLVCVVYAATHLGLWKGLERPSAGPDAATSVTVAKKERAEEKAAVGAVESKGAQVPPGPAGREPLAEPSAPKKALRSKGAAPDVAEAREEQEAAQDRWAPSPPEPTRDKGEVVRAEGLVTGEPPAPQAEDLPEEELLAREDRRVGTAAGKSRPAAAPRGAAPEAADESAMPEVGETVVSLTDADGRLLGELRMQFRRQPVGERLGGIRILCAPGEEAGYGNERNPVQEERRPEGFVWPALQEGQDSWSAAAAAPVVARPAGEAEEPDRDRAHRLERITGLAPAPDALPPGVAFSLEGEVLVDRDGRPAPAGAPPWLQGPMRDLRFEAGRCMDGRRAAALVSYRAEWTPAD